MRLLILGGTRFLGRHLVEAALVRGHKVTLFNRGLSGPDLFRGVEKLQGDRQGNLEALKNGDWDAVVDTSGYISTSVRATVELLAARVAHYTFISSISVYRDFSVPGLDESAPVATLPEDAVESEGDAGSYGARKARCEAVAEHIMPGRVLLLRSGIMVGPHDYTGRFTYWARRLAHGGEILAPAPPKAPVQFIDVRDLAEWTVRMAEARTVGTYNVVGPSTPLSFAGMLEQCAAASSQPARVIWVDEPFLLEQKVKPFADLPFWIPASDKTYAGFFAVDNRRALDRGLTFRSIAQTARDIIDSAGGMLQIAVEANAVGLTFERESSLLQSWKAG